MWSAVRRAGVSQPTVLGSLVISGMNDVLNSQSLTRAAWRNRIPTAAWAFMGAIAICCNILLGFASRHSEPQHQRALLLVLPVVLSISFLLLADIDSPRGGFISILPQNLMSLAQSLR
jgi:hypothetical protein